jgi:glyoxylase-like metal-dependent hydrolase (beta-lactamase superfamily II)
MLREFASKKKISCNVYAQKSCADAIKDSFENLSQNASLLSMFRPIEEKNTWETLVDPDYTCSADFTFDEILTLDWEDLYVILKSTPGHTPGSICMEFHDQTGNLLALATGDSLIPDQKTITRLPGGSKKAFREITMPYLKTFSPDTIILPGHGKISVMKTLELS